jgi:hypothetical protein
LLAKKAKIGIHMASFQLVEAKLNIIMENVKIYKTIFVEIYTPKE